MTDAPFTETAINKMSTTYVSFFLKRHTEIFITLFLYSTIKLYLELQYIY